MIIAEAEADELELDADCLEQALDDVGIDSLESAKDPTTRRRPSTMSCFTIDG